MRYYDVSEKFIYPTRQSLFYGEEDENNSVPTPRRTILGDKKVLDCFSGRELGTIL